MTKSELIKKLSAKHPNLKEEEIENLVAIILNEISQTLANEDRVELRGFGAFSIRKREARKARNPRTGETVEVGERKSIYFRPGKELKEKLNS